MQNREALPELFYSRNPLPEKVDLIKSKIGDKDVYYWMLSLDNPEDYNSKNSRDHTSLAPYDDNESELVDCNDLEDNYEINPTKSGKYITTFYVPPGLQSFIIGPRGSKLKELQDTTSTLIKVPKPGETGNVKITGHSERSVASARTQIALILLLRRERMPITHFITIPVVSEEIQQNFHKFKTEIINGPSTRGIDETIFQKPGKLHLTLVTLVLLDEQEIEQAKAVLNNFRDSFKKAFGNQMSLINLRGVEIMNDDPSDVNVLYGKVSMSSKEETEKLQNLSNDILELFYKNGLVRRQNGVVKLHMTLMNSLFRKVDEYEKQGKEKSGKRESFDATYILNKYKDFFFGRVLFKGIELSIRFTTAQNGFYDSAVTITL